MRPAKSTLALSIPWVVFAGGYAAGALLIPPGPARRAFGDISLCVVPLFANACLLWNASSGYRRQNSFWMLLAVGSTAWLAGQLIWTYEDLVLHVSPGPLSPLDLIFFLHTIPLMGSLALMPHARKMRETLRYGYMDLLLLAVWWTFFYLFLAVAWARDPAHEGIARIRDLQVYAVACLVFVAGAGILALRAKKGWRAIYANLFGASSLYVFGVWLSVQSVLKGQFQSGSLSGLPIMAAFVWLGTAGIIAHRISPAPEMGEEPPRSDSQWPARMAIIAILSMPAMLAWSEFVMKVPAPVRRFRLFLTLASIVLGTTLLFLRQQKLDRDRLSLMKGLQDSVENLKRLQTQFVQAEKLASLGQLAAGAAHEINNPLTAILGYAELMENDRDATEKSRNLADKIREQARRTKVLVTNLLSFARQVPAEKQLLDLKSVLTSAIELRQLDLRDKKIKIEVDTPAVLPAVRGDPNQLLQVFYNVINNAVDAMEGVGGGLLNVRIRADRGAVVMDFADTGPGLREPERVFDPFYTTKPVGKGTGLGLSICYGIVQEHGGQIIGFNRPDGGCTFRVTLPAVLALFPRLTQAVPTTTSR